MISVQGNGQSSPASQEPYSSSLESKSSGPSASAAPTTFFGRICKFLGIGSSGGAAAPSIRDVSQDRVQGTKLAQKNPRIGSAAQAPDSKGTRGSERGRQAAVSKKQIAGMKFGDVWRSKDRAVNQALNEFMKKAGKDEGSQGLVDTWVRLDALSAWSFRSSMSKAGARQIAKGIAHAFPGDAAVLNKTSALENQFLGSGAVKKSEVVSAFQGIRQRIENELGIRFKESLSEPPEAFQELWEKRREFPKTLDTLKAQAEKEHRPEPLQFLQSIETFRELARRRGVISSEEGKAFLALSEATLDQSPKIREAMSGLIVGLQHGTYPLNMASLAGALEQCGDAEAAAISMLSDTYMRSRAPQAS